MSVGDTIEIQVGLPDRFRHEAAETYYDAFRQKFEPIMRSRDKAIAILEHDLDSELAIIALHNGAFAGVSGLQIGSRGFADLKITTFAHEFGWLRGLLKAVLFMVFAGTSPTGQLMIESIAVRSSLRGHGIGTALLNAVFDYASAGDFEAVCLDVVDTNPRARQLYARMGFVETETSHYPFLHRWLGFSAVIRMVKTLG